MTVDKQPLPQGLIDQLLANYKKPEDLRRSTARDCGRAARCAKGRCRDGCVRRV